MREQKAWVLEREFRTVPGFGDVTSFGGRVRRYEVQPHPDRRRRYGITLPQLQTALTNANATVGGDYVNQGQVAMTVRSVGLFGGGVDQVNKVLGFLNQETEAYFARSGFTPEQKERLRFGLARREPAPPLTEVEREHIRIIDQRAAHRAVSDPHEGLRIQEMRRIRDIRGVVVASVNNQPVRVEDLVEGGRASPGELGNKGVVVSHQTRLGRIGYWKAD